MNTDRSDFNLRIISITVMGVVAICLLVFMPDAQARDLPAWNPQSSEKLVKLPASYLKKSLDRDFLESELGRALIQSKEDISLKGQTLQDLKSAIEETDGGLRTEMRHQFLAEKKAYLEMTSEKNTMHRKQFETKLHVFERILEKLSLDKEGATPVRQNLITNQDAAFNRFEAVTASVDLSIFQSAAVPESKYAVKYAANFFAIEKLMNRIQKHRMNTATTLDGEPMSKEDFIRQMIADTQAEMAILEQEDTILAYMAKLVALDASALSEDALDIELAESDLPANSSPAEAIGFFMSN